MYTWPHEQGILYTPGVDSCGCGSLGEVRICPIFVCVVNTVLILCFLRILFIRSVVPCRSIVRLILCLEKLFWCSVVLMCSSSSDMLSFSLILITLWMREVITEFFWAAWWWDVACRCYVPAVGVGWLPAELPSPYCVANLLGQSVLARPALPGITATTVCSKDTDPVNCTRIDSREPKGERWIIVIELIKYTDLIFNTCNIF